VLQSSANPSLIKDGGIDRLFLHCYCLCSRALGSLLCEHLLLLIEK